MTTLICDFQDIVGGHINGYATLAAGEVRVGQDGPTVVLRTPSTPEQVVEGEATFQNVDPGPAILHLHWDSQSTTLRFTVPNTPETVRLSECIEQTLEYTPPVVNRGLDLIEGARDDALGQVEGAVHSKADTTYVDAQDEALGQRITNEKWYRGNSPVDADTLFAPGSYNIKDSKSTGLPFVGIANLQVLPIVAGAAQVVYDWNDQAFWHRRTRGGVYEAWEKIPKLSDIPTTGYIDQAILQAVAGMRAEIEADSSHWVKRVPLAVTTGAGAAQGPGSGRYRTRVQFGAPVLRWKLHVSTRYPIFPNIRGGATITDVSIGTNAGGGQIGETAPILTGAQTIPAGEEWVSDWIAYDLGEDSLIDMTVDVQGEHYSLLAPAWKQNVDGTWAQVNRGPLWVWIEAETFDTTPTVALIGDSTGAGHGSIEPVWDSAVAIAGREQGFLPVLFASSGDTLSGNVALDDPNFARWSDYGPYDSVVIQAGSNDLNGGATLAEMQDRFTKVAAVAQQLAPVVVGATIKPRYPTDTVGEVRIPYNEWLLSRPDGVWTTLDYSGAVAPDGTVAAEDNYDGPHLKKSGHEKMATAYAPVRIARPRLAGDPGEDAAPQVTVDTTVGTRLFAGDTMIYGDTGWRNVVPLSTVPASGAWARIRRSGNTVELSLSSMKFETTGNVTLMTFPTGFRPSNHTPFVTVKYWSSDTVETGRVNMTGALEMRGLTEENTLSSSVIYTTSDPWPTSLPGTPA